MSQEEKKENESQFQLVKFKYSAIASQSKLAVRDFYFADRMISIKQSGKNEEIATRVWDASIILSHYLNENASKLDIKNKYVLEIGGGLGLTSIVLSLLSVKHVYLTDIDADCMKLAQFNINHNKCGDNISIHEFFWGTDMEKTTIDRNKFDIVIGADCIYLKETYKALVQTFEDIFEYNPNAMIILSFAERFHHQHIFYNLLQKNKAFKIDYVEGLNIDLAATNKIMIITHL